MVFMGGHDPTAATAENYRDFALEASGRSPAYERLATEVALDPEILGFLGELPVPKRQPNLLFAAARYLLGEPASLATLRALARGRRAELAEVMLARRTQTNEPARCATLLPLLASLPQPLALIEVGASAGLTLLPDRYSYDFGGYRIAGTDPLAPVLECAPRGPVPLPDRVPEVAWRAGLDLNPLDVANDSDMAWLECLVWPGEADRRARLQAAIATARRDPPVVHRGDLLTDVPAVARQAPTGATLVIFHTSVLAYVDPAGRRQFADVVRGLDAVWISNEAPGVTPGDTTRPDAVSPAYRNQCCALVQDGRGLVALTDGHGTWLHWLT